MSLPFLKKRPVAGLIMEYRKPDGGADKEPEDQTDAGLESAAEAVIRAVTAKDANSLAKAFRDMFEILDSEPHEEGPHTNEADMGDEV